MSNNPCSLNQVSNRNLLSIGGFQLVINKCPKVDFLCNKANIPGISLGTAVHTTYLRNIPVPGDKISYEDLRVDFLVEENLENYNQIYDLITNTSKEQTIIFPNTNSGYGTRSSGICKENQKLQPISHYGITKCNAEDILLQNGNAIIFRFATVFGVSPRMRLDLLVNEFVYKALTDKYITIFERKAVRNYIHIRDVASVFEWMVVHRDIHRGEIFNVGLSDANINKQQLAEMIKKYISDFAITYSDYYEDPDKRDYIVSNEKVESTGWLPKYNLDDGIKELIMAYQIIINNDTSHFRNGFPLTYGAAL